MARGTSNAQLWSQLSQVGVGRNKTAGNATTITADVAAGGATFAVASATGLTAGVTVRLDTGSDSEICVVASVATLVVTPRYPVQKAHLSGVACVEQQKTNLGPTTDDGVDTDLEASMTALFAGTRRLFFGLNGEHFSPILKFGLKNFNQENLAFSLGMKESEVAGTSTSVDPRRLFIDGTKLGLDVDQWLYWTGVLHDTLTNVEVQAWGVEIDWSKALKSRYKLGGDEFVTPVESRPTSGILILSWQ